MSLNKSKGKSTTTPTSSAQYTDYTGTINDWSGGRLADWAKAGTQQLSADEIKAYGGLGETRKSEVDRVRGQAIDEIAADPSLSVAQRQRSRQLTDQDAQTRLDAIAKETEGMITNLVQQNNALTAQDLETLAKIFYGGKSQETIQKQSGMSGSFWG